MLYHVPLRSIPLLQVAIYVHVANGRYLVLKPHRVRHCIFPVCMPPDAATAASSKKIPRVLVLLDKDLKLRI